MDQPRTTSGPGEDNAGIPDDLRCKRSDGKQWRCTAMSMPDKTVCEKHYIQAKKRAANSAMRASLKKAKRKSRDENDIYSESKSDDMDDSPLADYPVSVSGKKYMEKASNRQFSYSPETPSTRGHNTSKLDDDQQRDITEYEENPRSYKTPPPAMDSLKSISEKAYDASATTETSDGSSDSSDDMGGQTCHQCHRNDRDRVFWCLRCDRRGYCDECISTWYSDISLEEIQKICPACRGICNCKTCLRGDNLIKVKIRDISGQEKLEHLYCLLSSVLPVVKRIHSEQCSELVLERRLRGNGIDLARTKLNADEQMCCDFCRTPIIDYHRHCAKCSFDICLSCCQDLRESSTDSTLSVESVVKSQIAGRNGDAETQAEQMKPSRPRLNVLHKFSNWKANADGSIPCPPMEYGGCGYSSLILKRIFKMNWVAKLVKNVEEMVSGCKVYDDETLQKSGLSTRICQYAHRENSNDNFLYCPSSQDIKDEGIREFRKHWVKGEPVIVREVCDVSSMLGWDPMVMWRGIQETTEEKMEDDNRIVKAIDCLDRSEIDIALGEFIKGYAEGRIHEDGWPQMLKLKNWPSPSASEEFLLYQRPEFISKLPLLEYIHSKWGLLNVAAKLPHYSLQNDVGPKILISYGMTEELGRGDSVNNLHTNMRDVVYLLVHNCEVKVKGWQRTKVGKLQTATEEAEDKILPTDSQIYLSEGGLPRSSLAEHNGQNDWEASLDSNKVDRRDDQESCTTTSTFEEKTVICQDLNRTSEDTFKKNCPGALWDVFRHQDVPKLIEYTKLHWEEFGIPDNIIDDSVPRPLYDGVVFLNSHHKRKLKEEYSIESWSFEQHLGEAMFIPAGCPFQVRNLQLRSIACSTNEVNAIDAKIISLMPQSTVQLGLDFLSPESLGEAVRLAEEIRGLPNDHESKLQMLEVGKISLYAASSAIKEVQKLVLDPKVGAELGFEDPNLTSLVSMNLEKMMKQRQVTCA